MEIVLIILIGGAVLLPMIATEIEWLTHLPWWICLTIGICGMIWMIGVLLGLASDEQDIPTVVFGVLVSVAYIIVGHHKYKRRRQMDMN